MSDGLTGSLSRKIPSALAGNGDVEAMLQKTGELAFASESSLIEVFTIADNIDGRKALAKTLGIEVKDGNPPALAGLQQIATERFQRVQRTWASIEKALETAHQSAMRLINNIRN